MKVLVLEDDPIYADLLSHILQSHGHDVSHAEDGARAVRLLEAAMFDLVILDWGVPIISGFEVLRWIRHSASNNVPVLFVTNRLFEKDIVQALNAGADDYVVKPVSEATLIAKINALTRRRHTGGTQQDAIAVGDYMLDSPGKGIYFKGEKIEVTQKEFDIALALFQNLGVVVPRDHLINLVWGKSGDMLSRSLDTHVYRIRAKLFLRPANGVVLKSIYTVGYRLDRI